MKKKISKNDWGRKKWVNILILGLGMVAILQGGLTFGNEWNIESGLLAIFGAFVLMWQHDFLWRLIEEKWMS